jgi:hypothetical protein
VTRLIVLLPVLALALTACGSGGDASGTLRDTAARLDDLRSGTLTVKLIVEPRGGAGKEPFGFELHGPFALGRDGKLPQLDVEYTQIANGDRGTARVISNGEDAWVDAGGGPKLLSESDQQELAEAGAELAGSGGGIGDLDVANWFREPKQSGGPDGTDRITSEVDVVNAANDLLDLARRAGANVSAIRGADAQQLDDATRSARLELLTGAKDHLLRELNLDVDLGVDVPKALESVLTSTVGAKVHFELKVEKPNEPVSVKAP